MRNRRVMLLSVAILQFAAIGCEARVIHPTISATEYRKSETRLPGTIVIYLPKTFMDFTPTSVDVMAFRKWEFRVAETTGRALRYALEAHFDTVKVSYEKPKFPIQDDNAPGSLLAVVKPIFRGFKTKQPYLIKFEGYRVSLTLEIQLLTREGSELFSRRYKGSGKERFVSVFKDDVGHFAFRKATRVAIKEVVDQASGDIVAALRR